MSEGQGFTESGGAALYAQVCAACHQAGGEGATGAAAYPALLHNEKLASAAIPSRCCCTASAACPRSGA